MMTDKIARHYFYDDATRTVFHTTMDPKKILSFSYMGMSDNPNPKMAAAVFMQHGKALSGCKIREYIVK